MCLAVTASTSTCLETIINKIRPITPNSQDFLRASCGSFLSNVSGKEADVFQIAVDSNLDKAAHASTPVPKVRFPLFLIIFPTITVVASVAFPSKPLEKKPWNTFPDQTPAYPLWSFSGPLMPERSPASGTFSNSTQGSQFGHILC